MRDDQGRLLQSLDDVRHRKGLAGASNTEQGLELISLLEAERQLFDGLRLITGRCIVRMKLEFVVFHSALQIVFSVYHRSTALNTCLLHFHIFLSWATEVGVASAALISYITDRYWNSADNNVELWM